MSVGGVGYAGGLILGRASDPNRSCHRQSLTGHPAFGHPTFRTSHFLTSPRVLPQRVPLGTRPNRTGPRLSPCWRRHRPVVKLIRNASSEAPLAQPLGHITGFLGGRAEES